MLLPSRLTLGLAAALAAAILGWTVTAQMQRSALRQARTELVLAHANVASLEAAIADQNTAIEQAAAAGRKRREAAEAAIANAPVARERVVDAVRAPAAGGSVAERMEDIDRRFLEGLN